MPQMPESAAAQLESRANAAMVDWHDATEIDPVLLRKQGRLVDPNGHNPIVFPSALTSSPDGLTLADVIVLGKWRPRPPNRLPDILPAWLVAVPQAVTFLRRAPLSRQNVRGMLRSRYTCARRIREYAEHRAATVDAKGKGKERILSMPDAHRLLLALLPIADAVEGVERPVTKAITARIADLTAEQRTRPTSRRVEAIGVYRDLRRSIQQRVRDRSHEVDALFAEAAQLNKRQKPCPNPNYPNSQMWDPPLEPSLVTHTKIGTTKKETIPIHWLKLPMWDVPYMDGCQSVSLNTQVIDCISP